MSDALLPHDLYLPGSSIHGILQVSIVEWVAMPSPGGLPDPGIKCTSLMSPALADGFFPTVPPGKPAHYTVLLDHKLLCTETALIQVRDSSESFVCI